MIFSETIALILNILYAKCRYMYLLKFIIIFFFVSLAQGFVKKIVSQFLSDKCLILHYDEFASSVTGLTVQFKELHEELKFDICDLLTTIVGLSILEVF